MRKFSSSFETCDGFCVNIFGFVVIQPECYVGFLEADSRWEALLSQFSLVAILQTSAVKTRRTRHKDRFIVSIQSNRVLA